MQAVTTTSPAEQRPYFAFAMIGLAILAAALTPITIRYTLAEGVPSIFIVAARLVLASVILGPLVLHRYSAELRALTRRDLILAFAAGFWLAINLILLFKALEYTTVLVTSVLRRTTPLWIIGPEIIFFGAVFTRRVWVGMAITILGGLFIGLGSAGGGLGLGSAPLTGAVMAVFGAGCVGFYMLIGRQLSRKLSSLTYSWLVFTCAAVVMIVFVVVTHTPVFGYSLNGYIWVLIVTFIAQFVGHISINTGLSYFQATTISLILQMTVVGDGLLAFLFFREIPAPLQLLGSALVMVGVILATIRRKKPAVPAP